MEIQEFLRDYLHLTDEGTVGQVLQIAKIEHFNKGELLFESGQRLTSLTFLLSGVLRGFLIDLNGKDITDCFAYRPGEAAMPCNRLDQVAQISIEAVTPCEVLKIPVSAAIQLIEENPQLCRLYNQYLIQALERHWEVKMLMYQYTAMQRYEWFLKRYPELAQMISGRYIASYLGMTPVTLSRLRGRLRKKAGASSRPVEELE